MDHWNEEFIKTEMIEIGKMIYDKGYIAATDGNISVRINENEIFMTPSGIPKGRMKPDQIVRTDMDGNVIGEGRPSSEILMHLFVYKERSDARAVVHAHPPHSTAFSIAGVSLAKCVFPEIVVQMGAIHTAPYATPSTPALPASIKDYLPCCDAMILERHGTLTLGVDLQSAYHKLEKVEHTAHISLIAHQLGGIKPLSQEEVEKLMEVRKNLNIKTTNSLLCENCSMISSCCLDMTRVKE